MPLVLLQQLNVNAKIYEKLAKIAEIEQENLNIFRTTW